MLENKIIDEYFTNGVVLLKNIIEPKWIQELQKGVELNFKNPSKYKCVYEKNNNVELFYDDYCNWQIIKEYKNFIFNSNIANIAKDLMQSKKVNLFHEHVLIKEAKSQKKTPWHQDQSYYCVNGQDNCSIWIPLDPIAKNISPEFIIGSHKWNKQFLPIKFFGYNYEQKDNEFENIPNIEENRNKYQILSWKLNLGDAVAFNFATIHSAPENKSTNRRRAFSVRFTGDDSTYIKRMGEMSPPFPELNLKNGDSLDCDTFPLLISS